MMNESEELMGDNNSYKFQNPEDRKGFIRKVYSILTTQLIITALITLIPLTSDKARTWMV